MPKIMKKRHRCLHCRAMKYAMYMRYERKAGQWRCADPIKCIARKAGFGVSYR